MFSPNAPFPSYLKLATSSNIVTVAGRIITANKYKSKFNTSHSMKIIFCFSDCLKTLVGYNCFKQKTPKTR